MQPFAAIYNTIVDYFNWKTAISYDYYIVEVSNIITKENVIEPFETKTQVEALEYFDKINDKLNEKLNTSSKSYLDIEYSVKLYIRTVGFYGYGRILVNDEINRIKTGKI